MSMGKRLKKVRKELNKTQELLASDLGISLSAYQNYERDKRDVPYSILYKITTYGIDSTWLLTGKGDKHGYALRDSDCEGIGPEPVDDVELIMQLTEKAGDWVQKGWVKPTAKKALVKELFSLMKGEPCVPTAGKGTGDSFSNISITGGSNTGGLSIGYSNKIENKKG